MCKQYVEDSVVATAPRLAREVDWQAIGQHARLLDGPLDNHNSGTSNSQPRDTLRSLWPIEARTNALMLLLLVDRAERVADLSRGVNGDLGEVVGIDLVLARRAHGGRRVVQRLNLRHP